MITPGGQELKYPGAWAFGRVVGGAIAAVTKGFFWVSGGILAIHFWQHTLGAIPW